MLARREEAVVGGCGCHSEHSSSHNSQNNRNSHDRHNYYCTLMTGRTINGLGSHTQCYLEKHFSESCLLTNIKSWNNNSIFYVQLQRVLGDLNLVFDLVNMMFLIESLS